MIPSERLQKLTVAVSLGADPKPHSDEERAYIRRIIPQIAEIVAAGHIVDIPPEWEVEVADT